MNLNDALKIFLQRGYVETENGSVYDGNKWCMAIRTLSEAFENGYVLCKLDKVIEEIQISGFDVFNDGSPEVLTVETAKNIVMKNIICPAIK